MAIHVQIRRGLAVLLVTGITVSSVLSSPGQPEKKAIQQQPKDGLRIDSLGDPLPPGAVARLGTVRLRQGAKLSCMAVSVDGMKIVSGCRESGDHTHHKVFVWDAASGKPLRELGPHPGVECVAISADGTKIASGGGEVVCVWDTDSGKKLHTFKGRDSEYINAVAFAPDGKHLAAAGIGIHWWNLTTEKEQFWLPKPIIQGGLYSLAFSPDGKTLASGGHDEIVLWLVMSGNESKRFKSAPGYFGYAFGLAFSPDGRLVSGGQDGNVRLWDPTGKQPMKIVGKHSHPSNYYGNWLRAVAVSPDGQVVASAGYSPGIRLWDVKNQKQIGQIATDVQHFSSVAFTDKGQTLVSAWDSIRFWDAITGKEKRPLPGHHEAVKSISISSKTKTLASAGLDGTIRFWNLQTNQEQEPRITGGAHEIIGGFTKVVYSPDGKTVATISNWLPPVIRLWDTGTGKLLHQFKWHQFQATCVAFSPDGKRLAGGMADKKMRLWEVETGKLLWELPVGKTDSVHSITFSPNGKRIAAGSYQNVVIVRDAETGKEQRRYVGLGIQDGAYVVKVNDVAFSPDGSLLAGASSDGTAYLWDFASGKEQLELGPNFNGVNAIAFSPNGKLLASGGRDPFLQLWDVATGKIHKTFSGHRNQITGITFAPDGKTLASASADTTILIWEVPTIK